MIPATHWMAQANCIGGNADIFFPRQGESPKPALAVCAGCMVRTECLDYALRNCIKVGIWGGTAEKERRRMRRKIAS